MLYYFKQKILQSRACSLHRLGDTEKSNFKNCVMMYQWTVLCFILAACGAQQHLTCLRTDEILTPSPPISNDNVQQGRPGRRGPIGPVGLQGLKGEPGIPDNSVIDELKGKKIVYSASTLMQICRSKCGRKLKYLMKCLWDLVFDITNLQKNIFCKVAHKFLKYCTRKTRKQQFNSI